MSVNHSIWCPVSNGLSFSMLNLWAVDRSAFKLKYLDGWLEVQGWQPKFGYGNFIQSSIEGYIKSKHQMRGANRFLQNQLNKDIGIHGPLEKIRWWAKLAANQSRLFVERYGDDKDYPLTLLTESERNVRIEIVLPSGRPITLNCYLDGEGESILFENKCRSRWDKGKIARQIRWDLQYNIYLLAWYNERGTVPDKLWYQHCLRPCGFGYRGPRQKKGEEDEVYLDRIMEDMNENPDNYFWRFIGQPTIDHLQRFCHGCLYPMLEAFLDDYEYQIHPNKKDMVNRTSWVTPYGLFNPFVEEMEEAYRNYRLTGLNTGLRRREHQ